ncbi:MAG TPA: efflux RND transporter periplasmic adaptor subunit [Candidatus Paceibacterota bacterium]|nr:efflux RND transporter periplasmic adaptor subunit [Candidatus Paceibacterota bacterium]
MFTSLFARLKRPAYYIPLAILIAVFGGIAYGSSNGNGSYEVVTVKEGILEEIAKVNGKVRAAQNVDLSLERGGRITSVAKNVGDRVTTGELILSTSAGNLSASVDRARANLDREIAKLESLRESARPEEIQIATQKLDLAATEVRSALRDLSEQVSDAYVRSNDAIRNTIDQFNSGGEVSPNFTLPIRDAGDETKLENGRRQLKYTLDRFEDAIEAAGDDASDAVISANVERGLSVLTDISTYLTDFASAINDIRPDDSYTQDEINSWKEDISAARTSVSVGRQNLIAGRQRLQDSKNDVLIAQSELEIKQTGGSASEIRIQEAVVAQMRADLLASRAELQDTVIVAPFAGIITRIDAEVGASALSGDPLVSLISEGSLEIEANLPEVTVARVSVGDSARVTLDAFGSGVTYDAVVTSVDLSGKEVDGVQSYQTTLQFVNPDERVKVGMTANVSIVTEVRSNAKILPKNAVSNIDGKFYVLKINGSEKPVETEVTVGMSAEGGIEVVSGLEVEDQVAIKN